VIELSRRGKKGFNSNRGAHMPADPCRDGVQLRLVARRDRHFGA
jgi:hypothetical protein